MQREVIRWLQSLDLTYQVRYPQQDLSNGFTLAEIASRYDRRVAMHSYVPGCSSECKRRNWKVLLRDLQRLGCKTVTTEMAEATIQGKAGVALNVLENFYAFFCGRLLPRRETESGGGAMTTPFNKVDVTRATTESLSVFTRQQQGKDIQPIEIETEKIAFSEKLQQPGFARPTAAALLHVANRDTRNVQLVAAIPGDELRTHTRNEKLLTEHKIFNKAYRQVEPERFAPIKHRYNTEVKKPGSKGLSPRKGPRGDNRVSVEKVSVVSVNTLNKQLIGALRQQSVVHGSERMKSAGDFRDRLNQEILGARGNNLRLGLSKVLSSTLQLHAFNNILEQLGGEDSVSDIFSSFVGRREELPFAAVSACWSALLEASSGIASVLLARPTEYIYLLRALHFVFSGEVMNVRMLHVSEIPKRQRSHNQSADTTLAGPRGSLCAQQNMTVGDELVSVTVNSDELQQVIFSNEPAYNVASAFCLLCSIAEALHAMSPSASLSLLTKYFIPTASRLFASANSAILEALARVLMAHVCGNGFQRQILETETSSDNVEQQRRESLLETQEADDLRQLTLLLEGPLKEAFFPTESRGVTNFLQSRFQYNLFMYHLLCHMQTVFGVVDRNLGKQKDQCPPMPCSTMTTSVKSSLTPVELCSGVVFRCLGFSSAHLRSIGIAMMVQLLAWDRWDLVIDPLFLVVNDVRQWGTSSGFLQRAADAWEIRVLLLKLLTVAFRKALYVIAEDVLGNSKNEMMTEVISMTKTINSTVVSVIKEKFNFDAIEEVIVMCLDVFSEAPLLQRQLAFQIVGALLLPEKQRKVAVTWLRGLFMFPADQLKFLLRSCDVEPPHLEDSTSSTQHNVSNSLLNSHKTSTKKKTERDLGEQLTSMERGGHDNSSNETVSSVRVLFGRVEPAYVIAPLNQSWDTFGVVQTSLMYMELLTTPQLFSLILAALLSPQRREAQHLSLFRSLHAVSIGTPNSVSVDQSAYCGDLTSVLGELAEKKAEMTLSVTLRSLVGTCNIKDIVNDKANNGLGNNRDDETIANAFTTTTVSVEDEKKGEEGNGGTVVPVISVEEREIDDEEDHMMQYEKAFWLSALRLLRGQLLECLSNDKHPQKQQPRKSTSTTVMETGLSTSSVCRTLKTENTTLLQELATTVLVTLYSRYGPTITRVGSYRDFLQKARQWLSEM